MSYVYAYKDDGHRHITDRRVRRTMRDPDTLCGIYADRVELYDPVSGQYFTGGYAEASEELPICPRCAEKEGQR